MPRTLVTRAARGRLGLIDADTRAVIGEACLALPETAGLDPVLDLPGISAKLRLRCIAQRWCIFYSVREPEGEVIVVQVLDGSALTPALVPGRAGLLGGDADTRLGQAVVREMAEAIQR